MHFYKELSYITYNDPERYYSIYLKMRKLNLRDYLQAIKLINSRART